MRRTTTLRLLILFVPTFLLLKGCAMGYESIYPPTPVGKVELKTLPVRTALETSSTGSMFERRDNNFSRLFNYISKNDVKMTVPVEADTTTNTMRFFAGKDVANRELRDDGAVRVNTLTTQTVISVGLRGSYTRERFEEGVQKIKGWLEENKDFMPVGDPYAVYWNSPFMPSPFRHSEVHQPVEKAE